jgi:drug/metabolite transporter (DMT)-like permease
MNTSTAAGRAPSVLRGMGAMTLVGSSFGVSRTLVHAPLFAAQGLRYAIAPPILLAAARAAGVRVPWPRGREWLWLAGIAVTGLVLFNLAIVRGVAHAQPAAIAVAVAFVPVLLGAAGPLLQGQPPSRRILLAAAVVTAGSVLVEGAGRADAAGVAWAVLVLVCETSFTLLAVPVLPRHGAWGVSVHSVWLGAIMFFVLSLVTEGPAAAARMTAADWAAVGYLALMVTAVAFLLWYSTVAALGPGLVGLLAGIAPIAAALTGMLTGGAAPGPLVWLGILVVLGGLATGLTSAPPRAAPPVPPTVLATGPVTGPGEGDLLPCSATTTPSPGGSRPSGPA